MRRSDVDITPYKVTETLMAFDSLICYKRWVRLVPGDPTFLGLGVTAHGDWGVSC